MKKILIICNNDLSKAPRFLMEVEALHGQYELWVVGKNGEYQEKYHFINYPKNKKISIPSFHQKWPLFIRKPMSLVIKLIYNRSLRKANIKKQLKRSLPNIKFDCMIVHHIWSLPVAFEIRKKSGCPIIFNAHEYYTKEFEEDAHWVHNIQPHYLSIAKKYYQQCDEIWTVSSTIAQYFFDEYNISPKLIENTKEFLPLSPSLVNENKIKLVHHGGAMPSRGLESMIEMMDLLGDRYHLYFYLVPNVLNYYNKIQEEVKSRSNITLCDPVPIEEISKTINKYDIGCYILKPSNFNNRYAMPNKFFEFIQARLMLAIGPSDEMKKVVEDYNIGVVADDFQPETLAEKIKTTSVEEIKNYKGNSNKAAQVLNSENNYIAIRNSVGKLIRTN